MTYAGIGARTTPARVLQAMTQIATQLAAAGWHLHSGGAHGADHAFARGTGAGHRTLFLPWRNYNGLDGPDCVPLDSLDSAASEQLVAIAARAHPAWHRCSAGVRKLHGRNAAILLGRDGRNPVKAVICWTENGAITGGTGLGLRIAAKHHIAVFNLARTAAADVITGLAALRN